MSQPAEEAAPFLGSSSTGWTLATRWATLAGTMDQGRWARDADICLNIRARLARMTRKQAVIGLATVVLFTTLLLASGQSSSISRLVAVSSSNNGCSNARLNPHSIKAPIDPTLDAKLSLWADLNPKLIEAGKDLPSLERPPFQYAPPTPEDVSSRTSVLSPEGASLIRERHESYVSDLPEYPEGAFEGRGIVMLAGGRFSEYAVTALGMLRESDSTLPVEVWRRDEREEKKGWCDELEAEGMACRRLSDYLDTDILSIADGKEMKVLTMLFSSFEEVVFLDADNMALQPPETLFDSEGYKETGVVLWPDFWKYDNADWLDYVVGISNNRSQTLWNQTTVESGQMVWNKRLHWKSLLLATYYNYYGPDLYYTLINHGYAGWGDKDTFPLALRALNESYYSVPYAPQNVWVKDHVGERRVGMLQMALPGPNKRKAASSQPNDKGTAMFLHATTIKWSHRDFICYQCLPIWHTDSPADPFVSRYEKQTAELSNLLRGNFRLLDEDVRTYTLKGVDPELKIWRAMEHAACRSRAWSHAKTCEVGRRYVTKTFRFSFLDAGTYVNRTATWLEDDNNGWVPGMDEDVCLVDPS